MAPQGMRPVSWPMLLAASRCTPDGVSTAITSERARLRGRRRHARVEACVSKKSPQEAPRPEPRSRPEAALREVADDRGAFNWALFDPDRLELHSAGHGGLEEMKAPL